MGMCHSGHIEFKKRYAYLVTENLGNFQRMQGGHSGSHAMAWAAITIFMHSGFPRTFS